MKQRYIGLLFAVLALLVGALLYATTRTSAILLNQWLGHINDGQLLLYLQSLDLALPHWMVYSLPDGLWMLAFITLILSIWEFKLDRKSLPWISMALLTGFGFEVFQGLQWIQGSFDPVDLLFMIVGALIPISYGSVRFLMSGHQSSSMILLSSDNKF